MRIPKWARDKKRQKRTQGKRVSFPLVISGKLLGLGEGYRRV